MHAILLVDDSGFFREIGAQIGRRIPCRLLTAASGAAIDRGQLAGRVAGALKISEADARARITELAAAQLLQDDEGAPVQLTDAGQRLFGGIRAAITEITERLWGDLPAEDLATASRVLSIVTARANEKLAAL